jgi:ribonuclease HII
MNYPTYEIEDELSAAGYRYIIGVDEVGRGPGAGPVVAAAVRMPSEVLSNFFMRVRDSKKLSERQRNFLYKEIFEQCECTTGIIDNVMIDEINILNATVMAMTIAINKIKRVDYIIVDGRINLDKLAIPYRSIVGGDNLSVSIAAASIIAKVQRDEIMKALHLAYPEYRWDHNKGYLTADHINAIQTYGTTEYHRMSFRKVGDAT